MRTPRVHPAYSLEMVTNDQMKRMGHFVANGPGRQVLLAAAHALANLTQPASATRLLPEVLDPRVAPTIAPR